MICNGWFVTPEIAQALFAAGMHEISVSVDYMDPARHDAQRGTPGAHAQALEALRALMDARTRPHQRVHMISVIMDDNLDDVEPLIRLCRRMGITYLVTLYSDHRGRKSPRTMPAQVSERLLDELQGIHRDPHVRPEPGRQPAGLPGHDTPGSAAHPASQGQGGVVHATPRVAQRQREPQGTGRLTAVVAAGLCRCVDVQRVAGIVAQ